LANNLRQKFSRSCFFGKEAPFLKRPFKPLSIFFGLFLLFVASSSQALSQQKGGGPSPSERSDTVSGKLKLRRAAICEGIKDYAPKDPAVVFSVSVGRIFCFTYLEPVPEKTAVYHSWYYRDQLITKQKLSLRPPRWATYSSIQLREYDKGPWRVTITDQANETLGVLRFSITD
jgi:hypothetical protein